LLIVTPPRTAKPTLGAEIKQNPLVLQSGFYSIIGLYYANNLRSLYKIIEMMSMIQKICAIPGMMFKIPHRSLPLDNLTTTPKIQAVGGMIAKIKDTSQPNPKYAFPPAFAIKCYPPFYDVFIVTHFS
jgi:hypothetical protein